MMVWISPKIFANADEGELYVHFLAPTCSVSEFFSFAATTSINPPFLPHFSNFPQHVSPTNGYQQHAGGRAGSPRSGL